MSQCKENCGGGGGSEDKVPDVSISRLVKQVASCGACFDKLEEEEEDDKVVVQNQEPAEVLAKLQNLVPEASSKDPEVQFQAVKAVRKLLGFDGNLPIAIGLLKDSGILPILAECLKATSNPSLQLQAVHALVAVTSGGSSEQIQSVVEVDTIPWLIKLLDSPDPFTCGLALVALGHIAADSPILRDQLISLDIMGPLKKLVADPTLPFLETVAEVIGHLCLSKNSYPEVAEAEAIMPALITLLRHESAKPEVLVETLLGICFLACRKEIIQVVIEAGLIPKMVSSLSHPIKNVAMAAIHAVGSIVVGTDDQTQSVLDCDALKYFPRLLSDQHPMIYMTTLFTLSNIVYGNQAQKQAVIDDANLIPLIISHLEKKECKCPREAMSVVRNMTANRASVEQGNYLVQAGVIPLLCNLLDSDEIPIIQEVLDAIHAVLNLTCVNGNEVPLDIVEECGGLDKIETLEEHQDLNISQGASNIITQFFELPTEDDDDDSGFVESEVFSQE